MDRAWVNPANLADIAVRDLDNRALVDGLKQARLAPTPNLTSGVVELVQPGQESWNLYELRITNGDQPPYTTITESRALIGAPQTAGSFVQEDRDYQPITLAALYNAKQRELEEYTNRVFYSAFEFDFAELEFWAQSIPIALDSRGNYNGHLANRIANILTAAVQAGIDDGGNVNAKVAAFWASLEAAQTSPTDQYWARDIKVFLFDRLTLQRVVDTANQNQWTELQLAQGTFTWQTRNASERVNADINAAYGDGTGAPGGAEWQALAAVDVEAASYNWPPFYDGPWGQGAITVQQMMAR